MTQLPYPDPAARSRSRSERGETTRRRILDAAIRLVAQRGYADLRVADVAEEAGISVGAQLHHFPTKDALVIGMIAHAFGAAAQVSRRSAATTDSVAGVLDQAIEDAIGFFYSERFLVGLNVVMSTMPSSDMRDEVLGITARSRVPVENAWRDAMLAAGLGESVATEVLALTFSVVRGFAIRHLWDEDDAFRDRCLTVWRDMVHAYLASGQGAAARSSSRGETPK